MTWEPRPLPHVTPETAPYWEAAADERLLLTQCLDCDLVYYYPRAHCPDCHSANTEWVEATGTGTVYSYTATEQVTNWPEHDLPLVAAYVELDEGPRMFTALLDCNPDDIAVGTRVTVRFEATERDDVSIPAFEPID